MKIFSNMADKTVYKFTWSSFQPCFSTCLCLRLKPFYVKISKMTTLLVISIPTNLVLVTDLWINFNSFKKMNILCRHFYSIHHSENLAVHKTF